MKDLVVIELPLGIGEEVSTLQEYALVTYGCKVIMKPHITIVPPVKFPFGRTLEYAQSIVAAQYYCRGVIKAFKRYKMVLYKSTVVVGRPYLYSLSADNYVVCLSVSDPSGVLKNLQKRLRKTIFGWFLKFSKLPECIRLHITLAEGLQKSQAEDFVKFVESLALTFSFPLPPLKYFNKGYKEDAWTDIFEFSSETIHPTHRVRTVDDSWMYDNVCELCGLTDTPSGFGGLANPCSSNENECEQYSNKQREVISSKTRV